VIAQVADARRFEVGLRWRRRLIIALVAMAAPVFGILAGILAENGQTMSLALILLVLAPVVAWWRLPVAVLGLFFIGVVVEQFHIGVNAQDVTESIPLYTSLNSGVGISGVYLNPMEIVMITIVVVILLRMGLHQGTMPRSALFYSLLVLLAMVALGAIHGLGSHGAFKEVIDEVRPLCYLAMMYFLVSQLPVRTSSLVALEWTFIGVIAVRSLQGTILVFTSVLGKPTHPEYLLSHEDSLFLAVFVAFVAALWLFERRGRMRRVATFILPFAFLVLVANNRRAGWLMLGSSVLVLLLFGAVRLPQRRRLIITIFSVMTLAFVIYLPIFWNHDQGLVGEPARAIRSEIDPDARDQLSDLYRQGENIDLGIDIKSTPILGSGYGLTIPHAIPIVNLSPIDPSINFVPHDTILYIWYRLGSFGALAFWSMIGFAIVAACRLLRSKDPEIALYATFAVMTVLAYIGEGYVDLGLAFYRIAVFVGAALGGLEVARRIQLQIEADTAEQESVVAEGRSPTRRRRVSRRVSSGAMPKAAARGARAGLPRAAARGGNGARPGVAARQ
jgi:hypothetical protein